MGELAAQVSGGEPAEGMYLTYLLSSDKLSRAEVYISVTELMLGGVDTVSTSHCSLKAAACLLADWIWKKMEKKSQIRRRM